MRAKAGLAATIRPSRSDLVDALHRALENLAVSAFGFAQRFFRHALLVPEAFVLQHAAHRGRQPHQPVLQKIVGGALSHGGDGDVFADEAGHHDERNVQAALLQQTQRARRVKPRQVIVGQDHGGTRVQAGQVIRLGLHPLPERVESAPPQLLRHQFGVLRTIFENQHANGGGHSGVSRR